MVYNTKDIENVFQDFYEHLYSVKQERGQGQQEAHKKEKMKAYVRKANLPRLPEEISLSFYNGVPKKIQRNIISKALHIF